MSDKKRKTVTLPSKKNCRADRMQLDVQLIKLQIRNIILQNETRIVLQSNLFEFVLQNCGK